MTSPESPRKPAPAAPPKAPLVMLGLLSIAAFAGPFLIYLTIRGGDREVWPPDRPVEWVTLVGVSALVVGLMVGCLTSGKWSGTTQAE